MVTVWASSSILNNTRYLPMSRNSRSATGFRRSVFMLRDSSCGLTASRFCASLRILRPSLASNQRRSSVTDSLRRTVQLMLDDYTPTRILVNNLSRLHQLPNRPTALKNRDWPAGEVAEFVAVVDAEMMVDRGEQILRRQRAGVGVLAAA